MCHNRYRHPFTKVMTCFYHCRRRRIFGDGNGWSKERSKEMWIDADVTLC